MTITKGGTPNQKIMASQVPAIKIRFAKIGAFIACVATISCQNIHGSNSMNAQSNDVNLRLQSFSKSTDPKDLEAALQIANDTTKYPMSPSERTAKVKLLLAIVCAAERAIDPKYDEEDLPQMNVSPPSGSNLRTGVDPSAIVDDDLRKVYKAKISGNNKKAAYHNQQLSLRRLVQTAHANALGFFYSAYPGHKTFASGWNQEVRAELLHLAEEAGVSHEFRRQLEEKFK